MNLKPTPSSDAPDTSGYFLQPTVCGEQVAFICEDDVWSAPLSGGPALRLTNTSSEMRSPQFSPDGQWLAVCAMEEGEYDLYLMPAQGGPLQRITWLNAVTHVVGWSADGKRIWFRSTHEAVHHRGADAWLYQVSPEGGPIERLPWGPAMTLSRSGKAIALGRNSLSNSRWKRYRGGMVGELWVDPKGSGLFTRILQSLDGNPVCPFWLRDRLWFASDHEGVSNLYSCEADGSGLRPETFQHEYYVRMPCTDGRHVVYHCGGDLWRLDAEQPTAPEREQRISIPWTTQKARLQRRFFQGPAYLEDILLHPQGHAVALTARGKLFGMALWEQAAVQMGERNGVRYRLPCWLPDSRLVAISDATGEERLEVFPAAPGERPEKSYRLPPGRVQEMIASPAHPHLVMSTSRMQLWVLNLETGSLRKLDHSTIKEISEPTFSADGHWLAYRKYISPELSAIFLVRLRLPKTGKALQVDAPTQVTDPVRYDFAPSFDPEGQYLYFLSSRTYNPIWDTVQTATSFSRSIKPYLITLRRDLPNPFRPQPAAPGVKDEPEEAPEKERDKKPPRPAPLEIDLEGIRGRVIEFPVSEGIYGQILGLSQKVLFTEFPLSGGLDEVEESGPEDEGLLWMYDFEKQEREVLVGEVGEIHVTPNGRTLLYWSGAGIRVLEAGSPPPEENDAAPSRKSGWLDLSRIRISVSYPEEWRQMFREAWRLQREFFWNEELSGVDWNRAYERYARLLPRLGSRAELSDLIWEMQGELGTSHAYEYGGDYRPAPRYPVGWLGADLVYSSRRKGWILERILEGDLWKKEEHSPLAEAGVPVEAGDRLLAIGGIPVDRKTIPNELMVNFAGQEVLLTIEPQANPKEPRFVSVPTLPSERRVRYREWVRSNELRVQEATAGRVGYVHLPDMGTEGISEFHRGYLAQVDRHALIIDVRYNAGGMVSPLILEKLMHRHLGYDVPRWGSPESYPYHTIRGPLLALANSFTGSDGDMFSASFRALELGSLVGKRTWGGVIGIDSRYTLVDGTVTTQPQYSIWFHHLGWTVENYGVDPDLEVEDPPQAYARGEDPQLERAIQEILRTLEEVDLPPAQFGPIPRRPLP